ncbi:MAG: zf-HC2 domain-containing protein [Candidatus Aminicenantes bacterium]|jgi:hypothetical protein
MKDRHVREKLSEYIDAMLSEEEATSVKEHLDKCLQCREEYEDMLKIVGHMNTMERLETPEFFLEKVHARMDKPSSLRRLAKGLFFPVKIKVPLELAGLAAAALLVIYIVGIRGKEHVYELAYVQRSQPPAAFEEEKLEADTVLEEAITVIDKTDIPRKKTQSELRVEEEGEKRDKRLGAKKTVAQSKKDMPALAPQDKRAEGQAVPEAPASKREMTRGKNEQSLVSKEATIDRIARSESKALRVAKAQEQKDPNLEIADKEKGKAEEDAFSGITPRAGNLEDIIIELGGKILEYEFNKNKQILESLIIEIPANTYHDLIQTLEEQGDILKPYPVIKEKDQKVITIRLLLRQ